LGLLALIPIGLCGSLAVAFLAVCSFDTREAHYGPLKISGARGTYHSISSFRAEECVLFVEIPGEGRFSIHQIPREVLDRRFERSTSISPLNYDTAYSGHGDNHDDYWDLTLEYRDGVLVGFHGDPASFSRQRDGTYISLPMTYRELHEAWGKPDKLYRNRELDQPSYH
jgi:hypothetical protein